MIRRVLFFFISGCGGNINISNTSSFIITPFYGNWRPRDAFCKWHVTSQFSFLLQIMDVKLPQSNSSSCDHVTGQCGHLTNKCDRITLKISNYGKICDQQEVLKTYHIHEKEADFSLTARNNKDDIKLFLRISTSGMFLSIFYMCKNLKWKLFVSNYVFDFSYRQRWVLTFYKFLICHVYSNN